MSLVCKVSIEYKQHPYAMQRRTKNIELSNAHYTLQTDVQLVLKRKSGKWMINKNKYQNLFR